MSTSKTKILLVDDDKTLGQLLAGYLQKFGFDMSHAESAGSGLRRIRNESYDAVVLDVMLPGEDGFSVCRKIRSFSGIPILMLTARGELSDRVLGLELGADDYLPKPFEPRELVARLQSLIRRGSGQVFASAHLDFGPLRIFTASQKAEMEGRDIGLSTSEFEVLRFLASNPGRVYSRDQVLAGLRGVEWSSFDRSVDILISRLRQKLGDNPKQPVWIKTVWGTGYAFIGGAEE